MMGSMFGHKWVSSYGAEVDPDKVWQATLGNVSTEQLREGLKRLSDRGDEWPPSAPEFKKLCLDDGEHWEHKKLAHDMAEYEKQRALPKPPIDKAAGLAAIRELKQKLRGEI